MIWPDFEIEAWSMLLSKARNNYGGGGVIRPSLKRAKLEFKRQSCVFWVLFMYKVERKKLEIPEMSWSANIGIR